MRRADRLFQIVQELRRRKLVTARHLATVLEVSERTIYRDIRDLAASGVPIEGEAGVGYVLQRGYDLPPLMFTEEEIEALVLGARIIESWADPALAKAAGDVVAKVEAVLPDNLRDHVSRTPLSAPADHRAAPLSVDAAAIRAALRSRHKLHFHYCNAEARASERSVRPLALAFYGPVWLLIAWCELRDDFRAFRLDRMERMTVLDERFAEERGKTLRDFVAVDRARRAAKVAQGGAPEPAPVLERQPEAVAE
ncbi:helix-turn-helix transcriptional regulator [Pelagibius marinus]|uniref:helix-turn-helix transcriptional regulator n=1 Tax=Pelagibius marinus TaxID=2762760 RepID=UPI001872D56C|nr:YafY family protein [Pelagibius marinus]